MSLPTRLSGRGALLAAADLPLVRCFASEDSVGFAEEGAVVWYRGHHDRTVLMGDGEPRAVAGLFARVAAEVPVQRFTIPRPVLEELPEPGRPAVEGAWHWFYTRSAPPETPAEAACEWIDPVDHAEVDALLEVAFPTASSRPDGERPGMEWFGARDASGRIVACGNANTGQGIGPMLGSVAVHPDARRRGLASALTSWVTRRLLERGHPMVALGSYAGEEATHRLYRRLGYRDVHVLCSGRMPAA
ncbi:FR47-like protein [Stackebrandtia albiflava]|uniref:FR47-like protein n=1 Tax=Stackebrandtia albiflava TaxID=406432 RepID=A0A562VCR9_9ACTN|nr:GNAT family N-acetyltransferase [Stackebrandtia albiflava]TWJ15662.1 FR47-like protein [Stackebrandtia albiflava]